MAKPENNRDREWRFIKFLAELWVRIETWALIHSRRLVEATPYLVEQSMDQEDGHSDTPRRQRDDRAEQLATSQIDQLIDPDTLPDERERRIHRLTDGPPEFVDLRVDLRRKH